MDFTDDSNKPDDSPDSHQDSQNRNRPFRLGSWDNHTNKHTYLPSGQPSGQASDHDSTSESLSEPSLTVGKEEEDAGKADILADFRDGADHPEPAPAEPTIPATHSAPTLTEPATPVTALLPTIPDATELDVKPEVTQPEAEAKPAPAEPAAPVSPAAPSPVPAPVAPTETTVVAAAAAVPAATAVLAATPAAALPATKPAVNAGLVVLQWLTYAFWGWTVLALSFLTGLVVNHIFNPDVSIGDSGVPYAIASVLVLLPIAYLCDHFYSRKEPTHKTGPETLVMVIHAVLFALFGIGALIVAVFSAVSMLISSSGSKGSVTALITAVIITIYYGITFLRTLNPASMPWIRKTYKLFMLVTIGVIGILGIIGPVASERTARDDKLIVDQISNVDNAIREYTRSKNKLPENLVALNLSGDAKQLVDRELVTYKPEGQVPATEDSTTYNKTMLTTTDPNTGLLITQQTSFHYQLCVDYKRKSGEYNYYNDTYSRNSDGYSTSLYVYNHPAGQQCYKLKTSSSY